MSSVGSCSSCAKPLVEGGAFCPHCGTRRLDGGVASAIDSYVLSRVNAELSTRLKDQNSLVREVGDKAEDIVWRRFRAYFGAIAVCVAAIGWLGYKSVSDVQKAMEPVVRGFWDQVDVAKADMQRVSSQVTAVRQSVDSVSREAEAQKRRVADRGGEVGKKLEALDNAILSARSYQLRSEEAERRLQQVASRVEQRVEQLARQADRTSVRAAFPALGQPRLVTLEGKPWGGISSKPVGARWINLVIDVTAQRDYKPEEIDRLVTELKKKGLEPVLGSFGVGGAYSAGYSFFGNRSITGVFYFHKDSARLAKEVADLIYGVLSVKAEVDYSPPSGLSPEDQRFVLEQSGLDLQIRLKQRGK